DGGCHLASTSVDVPLTRDGDGRRSSGTPSDPDASRPPSALCLSSNRVVSCEPIGYHEVYDFEVAHWHNYIAADLVHHNTEAAAYEITAHMTGLYPPWWEGKRFEGPVRVWAAGDTMLSTRDVLQVAMLGQVSSLDTGEW